MEDKQNLQIHRIIYLISTKIEESLTQEEQSELSDWLNASDANQLLYQKLTERKYQNTILSNWKPQATERALLRLKRRINARKKINIRYRISIAASILLIASVTGFLYTKHLTSERVASATNTHADLLPASNKAVLKTSSGKTFVLNNLKQGLLSTQNAANINKTDSSAISFQRKDNKEMHYALLFDTLSNPKGGSNYRLTLSDGTKIILNTNTSIRFPEVFIDKQREIELLNGEIYIEVAHNAKIPFVVRTKSILIKDIGTHFDVSEYGDDETARTTLIEGSVSVERGNKHLLLHPGEQAIVSPSEDGIKLSNADIDSVIAWTTDLFHFDHADIKTVMKQLARWYNVEIVYDGKIPSTLISGEIYRNLKASEVLEGLSYLNVKFLIKGNKLIVKEK